MGLPPFSYRIVLKDTSYLCLIAYIDSFINRSYIFLVGEQMSRYTKEDIRQLQHCIYCTFLDNPRLYYDEGAEKCGTVRNTFTKYWIEGLKELVFFPPQIRLKMYQNIREYIYLVQSETPQKVYKEFKNNPYVVYLSFTLGNFDLLIQTCKPLEEIPDKTLLFGSRSNYIYPKTPYYSFETALDRMGECLQGSHTPSTNVVTYPNDPKLKGAEYARKIFPYIKYDLKANYTFIAKKLGLSFNTFYAGFKYLLATSTVLLPYYPFGYRQYSHHFIVLWTDYEDLIRQFFGYIPCHVSITKVNDALIAYAPFNITVEHKFFGLLYEMLETGLLDRFWTATPLYHWTPDL